MSTQKVFGSFKAQAANSAETGVKKDDVFKIPPSKLLEEPGFNERDYDDPEVREQIESFAASYAAGAFVPPVVVRIDSASGHFYVVDGHQRRRGALLAIERGTPIEHLVCVPFRGNNIDRVVCQVTSSQGLKLKPVGVAWNYLKLLRFGQSVADIAKSVGRSAPHIQDMLVLAEANADVQNLVNEGAVSATTAIETVRKHGEKAGELLASKLKESQSQGKTKIKPSAIKEWVPPRKVATKIYGSLSEVCESVKDELGDLMADPKACEGVKIPVDALKLRELVRAYESAEAVKERRDARLQQGKTEKTPE